ncbi:MAG: hypothetical protein MI922_23330, partial [Bacteroidales bacterium]|nr:hypothetical protein [Bacteroidales bacterium]
DGIVYFNGGSPINHIIDSLINECGFGAYYLHPFDNIKEAKNIINKRALFAGVINDIKLVSWTPNEIRAEVKRILEDGMVGGGFIFGTLVMPYAIPEKNIKTMLETAYEYGVYSMATA